MPGGKTTVVSAMAGLARASENAIFLLQSFLQLV
jgi:hypothetical protein